MMLLVRFSGTGAHGRASELARSAVLLDTSDPA